jgi:hypothetical protein
VQIDEVREGGVPQELGLVVARVEFDLAFAVAHPEFDVDVAQAAVELPATECEAPLEVVDALRHRIAVLLHQGLVGVGESERGLGARPVLGQPTGVRCGLVQRLASHRERRVQRALRRVLRAKPPVEAGRPSHRLPGGHQGALRDDVFDSGPSNQFAGDVLARTAGTDYGDAGPCLAQRRREGGDRQPERERTGVEHQRPRTRAFVRIPSVAEVVHQRRPVFDQEPRHQSLQRPLAIRGAGLRRRREHLVDADRSIGGWQRAVADARVAADRDHFEVGCSQGRDGCLDLVDRFAHSELLKGRADQDHRLPAHGWPAKRSLCRLAAGRTVAGAWPTDEFDRTIAHPPPECRVGVDQGFPGQQARLALKVQKDSEQGAWASVAAEVVACCSR